MKKYILILIIILFLAGCSSTRNYKVLSTMSIPENATTSSGEYLEGEDCTTIIFRPWGANNADVAIANALAKSETGANTLINGQVDSRLSLFIGMFGKSCITVKGYGAKL